MNGAVFVIFLITLAATVVFTKHTVTPEMYQIAESMCEKNEGIKTFKADATKIYVECENTAKFTEAKFKISERKLQ